MSTQRWLAEQNIHFIHVYKQYECLWDPKHPHYKDRKARQVAYLAVMKAMEMERVRDVIKRIRILRNTYNNEMTKKKNKEHYVSKISWLPHFEFLKDIIMHSKKDTKRSMIPNNDHVNLEDSNSESSADEEETIVVNTSVEKKRKLDPLQEVDLREKVTQPSNDNDEFGLFGRTVAEQLRQLPLEVALETEEMILSTIRTQRIRVLSSSHQGINYPIKCDVD